MHQNEPVSMVSPSGFHRPLIEPYAKFSLIRLSENILPAAFHCQLPTLSPLSFLNILPALVSRKGNRRVHPLFGDAVQVTALPSEDVLLHLHLKYYGGVRLPASSMPFRFLIDIVSCRCDPAEARVSQVALMSFGACRL